LKIEKQRDSYDFVVEVDVHAYFAVAVSGETIAAVDNK